MLLQVRKTILISSPQSSSLDSDSRHIKEGQARAAERRVKRFQILTKTPDPGIAKAYIAVQSLDQDQDTPESTFQLQPDSSERRASSLSCPPYRGRSEHDQTDTSKVYEKSEKPKSRSGGMEDRAADQYYSDEEWAERNDPRSSSQNSGQSNHNKRPMTSNSTKQSSWWNRRIGKDDRNASERHNVKRGDMIQGAPWIKGC